jgi:uncharacterized protein YacL
MKKHIQAFCLRGLTACGFGPLVLVLLYLILQGQGVAESLTVNEVCRGIVSLWALAFIAGGMNIIYQIERLPLMVAIFIHGAVLYIGYLVTYLVNGWLSWGIMPVMVFSVIFVLGYLAVWAVIYTVTRQKTAKLNEILKKKHLDSGESQV